MSKDLKCLYVRAIKYVVGHDVLYGSELRVTF